MFSRSMITELRKHFDHLRRDRVRLVESDRRDLSSVHTKFGGLPAARAGVRWPVCKRCETPLQFVAQVHATSYVHLAAPFAFFGFYYGWCCGGLTARQATFLDDEGYGNDAWQVHAYESISASELVVLEKPDVSTRPDWEIFEECYVTSICETSLPDAVAFQGLPEVVPSELLESWQYTKHLDELALDYCRSARSVGAAPKVSPHLRNRGLVLGGYPHWCNGGDKTTICPDCERPMDLLLQVSPDACVSASWGDVWTAYLFNCPDHKLQFGLVFQGT